MNHRVRILSFILAWGFVAQAQDVLQLERISGNVELFRGSQGTRIEREYKLQAGDVLRVAMDSRARVAGKNAKIDLIGGSILRVEKMQKAQLEEALLLYGNFKIEGSGLVVKFPNLTLGVEEGVFYAHVFSSEAELGKSLSGQKWEQLALSEVFALGSKDQTYTHVNCLSGRASIGGKTDLQLKSEELYRVIGKVMDPVTKKIGKDAIVASVKTLGFL